MGTEFKRWQLLAKELKNELHVLEKDPEAQRDAFYRALEFGTGGLRGVLGAGTNRMNVYTVRRATCGLVRYLTETEKTVRVAIGYDTRLFSKEFARAAAEVLAAAGARVFLYEEPLPTPLLSYAVRTLGCGAGIMITASHNPAVYNGYKVYGADGCQITEAMAAAIYEKITDSDYFDMPLLPFEKGLEQGLISYIPQSVYERYIAEIGELSMSEAVDRTIGIVYTPLNGTGLRPVTDVLNKNGYRNLTVVKEQAEPDGNFPTCPYPNPELFEAMALGEQYARRLNAELLLATDPDCDRVGVMVKAREGYRILTGNEVGVLLLDYILGQRASRGILPQEAVAVKTIVTTELAEAVAKKYGVKIINVLTGFKYIGEVIGRLEADGEAERFIFGFEESCGYLSSSHVRDKDGVNAAFLIAEMCGFYNACGKSLITRLQELYREFGFVKNTLFSYTFPGAEGFDKMKTIMRGFRTGITSLGAYKLLHTEDYLAGSGNLPRSDVLKFYFEGGSLVVRPSGTEPKIKVYISVSAKTSAMAEEMTEQLRVATEEYLK